MSRCCYVATSRSFVAVTLLVIIAQDVSLAQLTTHTCRLFLDATGKQQQAFHLSCARHRGAASSCRLVVYYNSSGTLEDGITSMEGLIKPPFGVLADLLPSPPAEWHSAAFNATEPQLNRTEPLWNATTWPMLYFHGGPSCKLLLWSPVIKGVQLPVKDGEGTMVLAFGGGLQATLQGGTISNTQAYMGVVGLADTLLTINGTTFRNNSVRRGAVYGSWSSHLVMQSATLSANSAVHGGVVYLVGSKARMVDCHVQDNVATEGGGGLYVKAGSTLALQSSAVVNNSSPVGGGLAVYDASNVSITDDSQFINNTARARTTGKIEGYYDLGVGGAMYLEKSNVTLLGVNITGNTAVMDGGAIRMFLGQLNVTNSTLSHNLAYRNGGAMYIGANIFNSTAYSTLDIAGTLLDSNTAQANGGTIMLERRVFASISSSNISNYRAWSDGAGIYTVMPGGDNDRSDRRDDLQTSLVLDAVQFEGRSGDDKMVVGPYFQLQFNNTHLDKYSEGVVWRRRLCSKGEYVGQSSYCEECPSYQFSLEEGVPGHNRTDCDPAPGNTHAPGGAVLVPLPGGWHGVSDTISGCSDCPTLNLMLDDIRRCPHPTACHHDHKALAKQHPYSRDANRSTWLDYADQLCNQMQGYKGILCGVCKQGFGSTAPFKCNRCLGVSFTLGENGGQQVEQPGPARISGLYAAYWFALTCWLLLCVRFSMLAPVRQLAAAATSPRTSNNSSRPVESVQPVVVEMVGVAATRVDQGASQQQQAACKTCAVSTAQASHKRNVTKSLDVTKALIIYTQWVMLIINLPVSWLPWAVERSFSASAEASNDRHPVAEFMAWCVGWLFGRSASLDCFLQAWGLLQGNTTQQIVGNVAARAAGRAIVVPFVLFLSVLLLQFLLSALRKPMLTALEKLYMRSAFFRQRLAGRQATSWPHPGTRPSRGDGQDGAALGTANSIASSSSSGSLMLGTIFCDEAVRAAAWKTLVDNMVATALAVSMFVYISIARTAFGMLLCVQPGKYTNKHWVLDVRLQCPTAQPYTGWGAGAVVMGVVLLVLCVAWPVGIAGILVRAAHKGKLLRVMPNAARGPRRAAGRTVHVSTGPASDSSAAHTTARLAVRYVDYAVEYEALSGLADGGSLSGWYRSWKLFKALLGRTHLHAVLVWDSILDLHRLTVALVSMCVMLHELHQLILMVLVLGSYLFLVLLIKPWRSPDVFRLQVAALAILLASCLGIMACAAGDAGAYYSPDARSRYMATIPWLVIVGNLCYLVFVFGLLVRCVVREAPGLSDLRAYLLRRFHVRGARSAW